MGLLYLYILVVKDRRSLAGTWMSASCECCVLSGQVEVSASSRSFVQRSPTECGVSECDRGTSTVRRPRPTRAVESLKKIKMGYYMTERR